MGTAKGSRPLLLLLGYSRPGTPFLGAVLNSQGTVMNLVMHGLATMPFAYPIIFFI